MCLMVGYYFDINEIYSNLDGVTFVLTNIYIPNSYPNYRDPLGFAASQNHTPVSKIPTPTPINSSLCNPGSFGLLDLLKRKSFWSLPWSHGTLEPILIQ